MLFYEKIELVNCMIYGRILRGLRENANLKQKDLAKIINVNENLYCMYESEYQIIPLKYLLIFANKFDVSLDYIFNFNVSLSYQFIRNLDNLDVFAKRFRNLRKVNNLTQVKMAKIHNTTHSVVSDYERGKKLINTIFLYAICEKYSVSADYLLGRVDEPVYWDEKKESERLENLK